MVTSHDNDRLGSLEHRVGELEKLLQQIAGMAKLLKWLFALLLFFGFGPFAAEKVRQLLATLSR